MGVKDDQVSVTEMTAMRGLARLLSALQLTLATLATIADGSRPATFPGSQPFSEGEFGSNLIKFIMCALNC